MGAILTREDIYWCGQEYLDLLFRHIDFIHRDDPILQETEEAGVHL